MLTILAVTFALSTPNVDNSFYATNEGFVYQCGETKKGDKTIRFLKQFEPHLELSEEEPEEENAAHFSWYLTYKMICSERHKPNVN